MPKASTQEGEKMRREKISEHNKGKSRNAGNQNAAGEHGHTEGYKKKHNNM